jgi:hypothetical protein
MTDAAPPLDTAPAHYRLSAETWEMLLEEYKAGATAPALEAKWRVSQSAIRKRVTKHGATKRDWGDREARRQAAERAAALRAALDETPEARAARLFVGVEGAVDDDEADPAALMAQALGASGRAMRGRLWAEAKVLAALAESYGRLARTGPGRADAGEGAAPAPISAAEEDELRRTLLARLIEQRGRMREAQARAEGRDWTWTPEPWEQAELDRAADGG